MGKRLQNGITPLCSPLVSLCYWTMMPASLLETLWFLCSRNTTLLLYFIDPASLSPFIVLCLVVLHLIYYLGEKSSVIHSLNLLSRRVINSFLWHYYLNTHDFLWGIKDGCEYFVILPSRDRLSVSPPFGSELALFPFWSNPMGQKWYGAISKAGLKRIVASAFMCLKGSSLELSHPAVRKPTQLAGGAARPLVTSPSWAPGQQPAQVPALWLRHFGPSSHPSIDANTMWNRLPHHPTDSGEWFCYFSCWLLGWFVTWQLRAKTITIPRSAVLS